MMNLKCYCTERLDFLQMHLPEVPVNQEYRKYILRKTNHGLCQIRYLGTLTLTVHILDAWKAAILCCLAVQNEKAP
jgi:hypothetical protein